MKIYVNHIFVKRTIGTYQPKLELICLLLYNLKGDSRSISEHDGSLCVNLDNAPFPDRNLLLATENVKSLKQMAYNIGKLTP